MTSLGMTNLAATTRCLSARCAHPLSASRRIFGSPSLFCPPPVRYAPFVQKRDDLPPPADKYRFSNTLHFPLFTASPAAIAPIVCVDVFRFSVKVTFVDG